MSATGRGRDATGRNRIALDTARQRGTGIYIPTYGMGGGGEFGATIDDLDREFAIKREPVAFRSVFTVAHDIFDNWFKLELEDGNEEKSKQFNDLIQAELSRLKARQELARMAIYERGWGYAILAINYEGCEDHGEKLEKVTKITEITAYGPPKISSVKTEKNDRKRRFGYPKIYYIKREGVASRLKIHYTRAIHFATRLIEHDWKGISTLDPMWDDLVTLRNIRWGMGQTMYRYGSGFPDIEFPNATKPQIQAWIDAGGFRNLHARAYFAHNKESILEFKGLAGRALNPEPYYKPIMENLSCGSGIPEAILRGVQAGALTGSEVNQQEYYGLISDEQTMYEPGIRELINIIWKGLDAEKQIEAGVAADQVEASEPPAFKFVWESGIEMSEARRAEIDLLKAQRLQILGGWHTIDELRKMEDPKDQGLPGGDGDRLPGEPNIPVGSQRFHVKTHPDGSHTVTESPIKHKRSPSS